MKPLNGIRVLDLTRYLAGPYCALLLQEFGADVIKIEPPGIGDECRTWAPIKNGFSGYFAGTNRGKKSLSLNLKNKQSRAILEDLIRKSDVLLHNYTYSVCRKFKMDYETIASINPNIIYCGISGFGSDGPYRDRKGFDTIFQAMGGVTGLTGEEGNEPVKAGVPIADVSSGAFSALSIMAALYKRSIDGTGECIDLALTDSLLNFLPVALAFYSINGTPPPRMGSQHPGRVPSAAFRCKGGDYVHISVTDAQWKSLCELLDLNDLAQDPTLALTDDRIARRGEVMNALSKAIAQLERTDLVERCIGRGVPCGEIFSLDEIEKDQQVQFRKTLSTYEVPGVGTMRYAKYPAKFRSIDTDCATDIPTVGQHTDEVLSSILGFDQKTLDSLREQGVI